MKALTWVKEKTPNGAIFPSCREGHTITYIPKLRCIFLFGGICNNRMNDLYRYDIDRNSWTIQETNGRQPTARCHHTAFYEDPYYFVFGGQGDSGRSLTDFYILHCKTWEWKRLFMLQAPSARHSTQICDMKNSEKEKILFGGVCWPGNKHFNDVWIINYKGVDFKSGMKELTGTVCTQKKIKGDLPAPRRGHCAIVYNKCLYVYGGKGEEVDLYDKDSMNWIHQLSFETWIWKKISGIARPASSRYFASYCLFEEDQLMMFGGIDNQTNQRLNDVAVLNLQDFHWSSPFIAGHLPTPRYNHAACVCDTQYLEKAMVVIGGLDSVYCNMDIYKLVETEFRDKVQWEKLTRPSPMEKMASEIAGATLLDQRNYMDELEHIISHERTYGLELEQEIEKLEEDIKLARIEHTKNVEAKEYENHSLEEECALKEEATRNLMFAISREQLIFESLTHKNSNLEDVIQNTESYLIGLDKLFTAVTKLKFNEQDEQDRRLRQLSEHTKDEVVKAKDLHKTSLQALKISYDEFNRLSKQIDTDLMIQRNNVKEVDKNLEENLLNLTLEDHHH